LIGLAVGGDAGGDEISGSLVGGGGGGGGGSGTVVAAIIVLVYNMIFLIKRMVGALFPPPHNLV